MRNFPQLGAALGFLVAGAIGFALALPSARARSVPRVVRGEVVSIISGGSPKGWDISVRGDCTNVGLLAGGLGGVMGYCLCASGRPLAAALGAAVAVAAGGLWILVAYGAPADGGLWLLRQTWQFAMAGAAAMAWYTRPDRAAPARGVEERGTPPGVTGPGYRRGEALSRSRPL